MVCVKTKGNKSKNGKGIRQVRIRRRIPTEIPSLINWRFFSFWGSGGEKAAKS